MNGTVKWFSGQKGYGFIDGDDGESYFVVGDATDPKAHSNAQQATNSISGSGIANGHIRSKLRRTRSRRRRRNKVGTSSSIQSIDARL